MLLGSNVCKKVMVVNKMDILYKVYIGLKFNLYLAVYDLNLNKYFSFYSYSSVFFNSKHKLKNKL